MFPPLRVDFSCVIDLFRSSEAAFARRRVIDPRGAELSLWKLCVPSSAAGSFLIWNLSVLLLGSRFRASKAAQSRRGEAKKRFPPDPLASLASCIRGCKVWRLWMQRIAASLPLFVARQPHSSLRSRSLPPP